MSICKFPIAKLASILYITTTRVLLLLAGSVLKGLLFMLPKKESSETKPKEESEQMLYDLDGEMFTLEEIADLLLTDQKAISNRLSKGETIRQIVDSPSNA